MRSAAEDPAPPVPTLPAGSRLGDFVVELPIGAGGMGQVYRAHQVGLDRPVALKVLWPALAVDADFVRRFRREARLMRDLDHPALLPVYAAGEDDGRVYLAMRLVPGSTLQDVLADGRLEGGRAVHILRGIAEGLDHAHVRGVLHRDIKPGNILIDVDDRAFLADFGISREIGSSTVTAHNFGTPRYMAPEQTRGDGTGHRADLYSLACVAFETLTGSTPFTGSDTVPLLVAHATHPVPDASSLVPELPRAVDDVFARALAKQPADRFDSAVAFVDALAAALDTTARPRRWPRGWPRRVRGVRSGRRRRIVAAVAAAAVVGLAGFLVSGTRNDRPQADPVVAEPASPTAAPFRPSPADYSAVVRGDLLYSAPLDGTPAGFVDSPATQPDSAREDIRYVRGALELEAYAADADTYTEVDGPALSVYVGEMDLRIRPGSTGNLCWSLRWAIPRQLASFACVDVGDGTVGFSTFRRGSGKTPLAAPVALGASADDRLVHLAVVVNAWQLSLYVDGRLVQDVPNQEVFPASTASGIEFEDARGPSLLRVEGLRFYELGNG